MGLQKAIILLNVFSIKKIFISFGGYWSFIPSLLGKIFGIDVYIILNGTDSASIPEIKYGSLRKFPLRWFCGQSYRMATKLLPVSESLIFIENDYFYESKSKLQGIKHFFPTLSTPIKVIHNGVDTNYWKPSTSDKKELNSFVSVFSGNDQYVLKGADLIIELANKFAQCKFYLVGIDCPSDLVNNNQNLFFINRLSREDLRVLYNKAEFYFQLSIFEGFGVALAEAMACECIPIGSSANIIPKIIGDSGFILRRRNISDLETLVTKALLAEKKDELKMRARKRIVENYTIKKREEELLSLIES